MKWFLRLGLICLAGAASSGAESLVKNFDMAEVGDHGYPAEWHISHPVHLERNNTQAVREMVTEGQNTFPVLRIIKPDSNDNVGLGSQEIEIPEGTAAIFIQARMRAVNVTYGSKFWHAPGVGLSFLYDDGRSRSGSLDQWLKVPEGDSGWVLYEVTIPVTDNAPRASVAVVAHEWTGILDIDWILVRAVPENGE
ncbi:MAG: hypothetical protein JJU05_12910 [Verrucomicrobia bacterium]|nr:hypothetical protein [Verrucomicrobiota bacterium]MCH8528468.1 hypothetical protein [Kiritimatiellia bacterium]